MYTSYFAYYRDDNAISIAGACPKGFTGRQYKKLAPKYWFFKRYKEDDDEKAYIAAYQKEVLSLLDPKKVYDELGANAVLLCWESPDKFCHRHLVAKWLSDNLNIIITEYRRDD